MPEHTTPTDPPARSYTVRRRIFSFFGSSLEVFDGSGRLIGFCRQKAFRLKEDLRFYSDASQSKLVLTIQARQIIDLGATYDVRLASGDLIGSVRRRALKSMVRDEWAILDHAGNTSGVLQEDSTNLALLRRFIDILAYFIPQRYHISDNAGALVATMITRRNPFVHKMDVNIHQDHDRIDDLMLMSLACLLVAVEGRQD
jgi:hypothetical protein